MMLQPLGIQDFIERPIHSSQFTVPKKGCAPKNMKFFDYNLQFVLLING